MSIEEMYSFVTNPKRNLQGIAIRQGKYFGVIYEYKEVKIGDVDNENLLSEDPNNLKESPERVILSFEYNILDRYGFDAEEFGKQEFGDLLGDILVDVIDKYGTGEEFESDD